MNTIHSAPLLYLCPSGAVALTGNATTISRLVNLLSPGSPVLDSDTATPSSLLAAVAAYSPRAIIALHAVRSGSVFTNLSKASLPPIILLLGGTDVNISNHTVTAAAAFSSAVEVASVVIAFSEDLAVRFRSIGATLLPHLTLPPIRVIPQSADITDAAAVLSCSSSSSNRNDDAREVIGLPSGVPLAIWAGGLRSVKDPLFLLPAWSAAYARGEVPALLMVGPPLDSGVAALVIEAAGVSSSCPFGGRGGVFLHPPVPRPTLLRWLRSASVLVNTSLSEGMSNTILEAQALGTPVAARRCEGNEGVIADGVTGLLFTTPGEGLLAIAALTLGDNDQADGHLAVRARIVASALHSVAAHHSPALESAAWSTLLEQLSGAQAQAAQDLPMLSSLTTRRSFKPSYVPFALSALSPAQRAASHDIVRGLTWLGSRRPFASVVSPAAIADKNINSSLRTLSWGVSSDKDAEHWPVSPLIFDFAGSAERGIVDGSAGWGCYWEDRGIYSASELFSVGPNERRTLHLGVDLGACAGEAVAAPFAARVHSIGIDASPLGYGPTVILAHSLTIVMRKGSGGFGLGLPPPRRLVFYTLYGHLSSASVAGLLPGSIVAEGESFATMGSESENGGWFPHVHFQIITEEGCGGWKGDFPGVARVGDAAAYRLLTPDANLILRCPWVAAQGWDPRGSDSDIESVTIVAPTDEEIT